MHTPAKILLLLFLLLLFVSCAMEKIVVIGSPGAGKSTFARALGDCLGIQVIHLDRYFWKTDWKELPRQTRIEVQQEIIEREKANRWIMEGSYLSSSEGRLQAADTIIFLDMPFWLCLQQFIKRHQTTRQDSRKDISGGCSDRLDIWRILKIITFPIRSRSGGGRKFILSKIAELCTYQAKGSAQKTFYILRSHQEIENFLHEQTTRQEENPYKEPAYTPNFIASARLDATFSKV